jgi:DNA-binding NtrC family response regulator
MTKGTAAVVAKMRVLVVDDEENAREGLKDLLESWGYEVMLAADGKQGLEMIRKSQPNVVLTDLVMPEMDGMSLLETAREAKLLQNISVIFMSAHGRIDTAVEAIKKGAYDFLTKPLDVVRLKILLENLSKRLVIDQEIIALKDKVRRLGTFGKLNGSTPQMKAIFKQIQMIAPTIAPVLISGEAGTGKELVAKAIHQNSKRKEKPYIVINCGAFPKSLLEAELFGAEKVSANGVVTTERGAIELADTGTIFLDEISEMSLDLQSKLLRFMEFGSFHREGGKKEVHADVRVVTATNKNLDEAVEEGSYREDLFHRLNVFSLKMPALRERSEDLPLLAQHFIEEFNLKCDKQVKGLSREALNIVKKYSWPGNVRELKNALERAVVVCTSDFIDVADLPENLTTKAEKTPTVSFRLGQTMEDVERDFLFHTINFVDGNKTKAAKMLDISLKTLHNKLTKYKSSI